MAYNDTFQENRVAWAKPFERTYKGPLDRSSMFSSYADALEYAKQTKLDSREIGGTSYIGQIVTVFGTGIDNETQEVAAYIITAVGEDAALQRLAQTTSSGDFAVDIQRLETSISEIWEEISAIRREMGALADSDTTYSFLTATTTDGAITVVTHKPDGTTESSEVQVKGWADINSRITAATEVANGKTTAHVYNSNTEEQFKTDIANLETAKFKIGDLIYFKEKNNADLWVTAVNDSVAGNPPSRYEFTELDLDHPDLNGYLTIAAAETTYATKQNLATEKADLTNSINTLTTNLGAVSEDLSELAADVGTHKTETTQAIEAIQTAIDTTLPATMDSKITTAIDKLDVSLVGDAVQASKTYIKAIKQVDGKIEATADVLPDYTDVYEAKGAAEDALDAAKSYTDTKIGDLGDSADVITHVGTVISTVNTNITGITSRVTAVENTTNDQGNRLATVESTVSSQGTKITNIETDVATLTGRIATVENTAVTKVVVGTEELQVKDNTVTISKISTDLLVNGTLPLILDCGNAAQK